jgi:ABC-type transport system substrate-binding protein
MQSLDFVHRVFTRGRVLRWRARIWRAAGLGLLVVYATITAACGRGPAPAATPTPASGNTPDGALPEPTGTSPLGATATPVPPTPLATPISGPVAMTGALPDSPGSLDPANATDRSALLITRHIYDGLSAYAPGETRAVPALAESWSASADGLTWTIHL